MRRSRSAILGSLFSLVLLGSAVPASGARPDARPPAGTVLDKFAYVGHSGLDGFGDYGDLYAHGNFAYVGSRCAAAHQGGDAGKWLIINTEDTSPEDCPGQSAYGGWGEVHVYDNTDPKQPAFLGTFSTGDSRSTRTDGEFTDHNTEVARNGQFFSSWYSAGIVWWTMNDHGVSAQHGQFVPPPGNGSPPSVWGVFIDRTHNVILASDMQSGLWIVKPDKLSTL